MIIKNTEINIFAGDQANTRTNRKSEQSKKNNDKNIYAGNLNMPDDSIARRRKEAMKDAMKIIGDSFNNELKIDGDIERRHNVIEDMRNEIDKNQKEIAGIDANKTEFKKTYGITSDSQEQLDLELLEKRRDMRKDPKLKLSEEERQRLEIIDKEGMTEYQKISLELDTLKEPFQKIIAESQQTIMNEVNTINAINLERVKTHSMVDANVAADKILDAASGEIMGMLIDETKDQIDKNMEEQKKAAEEKAAAEKEEVKKQEEKVNSSNQNDTTKQILDLNEIKKDVQKEVQDIIDKMKLLPEDIIGAAVDTSV